MENAADALKLAAWVLIFVAALSITMNAFSQAKGSIDTILTFSDREYLTEYIPPSGDTQRRVSYESIIPAIYRTFKENYKIVFPDSYTLYTDYTDSIEGEKIHVIDLSVNGIQDSLKEGFLKGILYGKNNLRGEDKKFVEDHFKNIEFSDNGLYEKIKEKKIYKESLGIYYEEETEGASSVPEANRTEKRVITYEEV